MKNLFVAVFGLTLLSTQIASAATECPTVHLNHQFLDSQVWTGVENSTVIIVVKASQPPTVVNTHSSRGQGPSQMCSVDAINPKGRNFQIVVSLLDARSKEFCAFQVTNSDTLQSVFVEINQGKEGTLE